MQTPLAIKMECAKGEICNTLDKVRSANGFPPCIMDMIVSSILADIRQESKIELINGVNAMLKDKEEELETAKKAAKKVLKEEPDAAEE